MTAPEHSSSRPGRVAWVALVVLGAASCSTDEGGAGPASGLDGPDHPLELVAEPVFTVGGMEAPEWAAFGSITALRFDAGGDLYVLDAQADRITVLSPEGALLRTVGRPGQGPGELSSPQDFVVEPGGGLAVFDFGHRGLVVYDDSGEYVRNAPVDLENLGLPATAMSLLADGGVVAGLAGRLRLQAPDPSTQPAGRPLVRFGLAEGDTGRVLYQAWGLPAPPAGSEASLTTTTGRAIQLRMQRDRAFEPGLHVSALPDGRIAVVDSVGYRVKLLDRMGREVGALERPIPPTAVTDAIRQAERERRLAELAERTEGMVVSFGGGGGGAVAVEDVKRMLEARLAEMLFADVIPVIERLAADGEGRLWVQRSSGWPGENGPTDVITIAGGYLGTLGPDGLRIPDAFGPNGLTARIVMDEFDVPTVVVERVRIEGG